MKNLNKRKYPAVIVRDSGKWFTGYCGDYLTEPSENEYFNRMYPLCEESNTHITNELSVKYKTYSRGRSAANIIVGDSEGYEYMLSMSSFDKLMIAANDPHNDIVTLNSNGWFIGEFMQVKQGSNYFISVVEEKL